MAPPAKIHIAAFSGGLLKQLAGHPQVTGSLGVDGHLVEHPQPIGPIRDRDVGYRAMKGCTGVVEETDPALGQALAAAFGGIVDLDLLPEIETPNSALTALATVDGVSKHASDWTMKVLISEVSAAMGRICLGSVKEPIVSDLIYQSNRFMIFCRY